MILGGRYGTICKETNKSFIHMEYEYAKSIGIPTGVIVISDKLLMKKNNRHILKVKHIIMREVKNMITFLKMFHRKWYHIIQMIMNLA